MEHLHVAAYNPLLAKAIEAPLDVHQAGLVGAAKIIGFRREGESDLFLDHVAGNLGLLYAESSAEAAASARFGHFDVGKALDVLEQSQGLLFDAEHAGEMAAFVVGDGALEVGAHVGDAKYIDDELREFVDARGQLRDFAAVLGIVFEEVRVFGLDGPSARTRQGDDGVVSAVSVDDLSYHGLGFFDVAGIREGLSAADLVVGQDHFTSEPLEDVDGGNAYFRVEHIDHASREERDFHSGVLSL